MKKIHNIIISTCLFIFASCNKDAYSIKSYGESDEYTESIGTDYIREKVMDPIFFDAMVSDLKNRGMIKENSELKLDIIKNLDSLSISKYGITKTSSSLKGIELFVSLKKLNVKGAKYTTKTSFITELKRVRIVLKLDTNKIYTDFTNSDIIWGDL